MVKLFQLQLEHYEKVEGAALSLEGKANQLGQMVRKIFPLVAIIDADGFRTVPDDQLDARFQQLIDQLGATGGVEATPS